MIRPRGEVFVLVALWGASAAARAGEAPVVATDLLPPYAVSGEARAAAAARITEPRGGGDFDPAPAPDGTWIAFASTRDSPEPRIYRRALEGGAVRRLTSGPGASVQPAVSPDGRRIAFACEGASSWDIGVIAAEGGEAAAVISTPDLDEIHPTWHPSGEAIAFSRRDPADGEWWVFATMLAPGAEAVRLCRGIYPYWSPAGGRIAFQCARGRGRGEFALWTIEVAETPGGFAARGGETELVSLAGGGVVGPAFGPRGDRIVFTAITLPTGPIAAPARGGGIMTVRADGSGVAPVATVRREGWGAAWAGERILFSSEGEGGRVEIWSAEAGPAKE